MGMVDTTSVLLILVMNITVKTRRKCSARNPKENTRKIPKQECKKIVDTHYIETCEERIHTHCEETVEKSHHSTRVVGHESHKVAHGHHDGYGGY